MPRQGGPRLALPRLPLPIARPGPRGTSLRYNGPLSRSVPGPVRSGKARRAFVRNGKAQDRRERGRVPGPLPAGCLPTDGDTQVIRRTTTQPVRSIKGQRPRTAAPIS
jgi:hypothetical protein